MREVDSSITIPFWPWENDQMTYGGWNSPLWDADGGIGGGSNNQCLADGPFRSSEYSMTSFASTYSDFECVRRRRTGRIPGSAEIRLVQSTPASNYIEYVGDLDALHGTIHCEIDGTMCEEIFMNGVRSFTAANDPVFFLHHSNVDKLWGQWQSQSSQHANALHADPSTVVLAAAGVTAASVMDLSNMRTDNLCVRYEDEFLGMSTDTNNQGVECPLTWTTAASSWFAGTRPAEEVATRVAQLNEYFCSSDARVPPVV